MNITPRNNKGERHGYWELYHHNGKLWCKGYYKDDKPDGYWEYYYYNGQLWYKGNYKDGKQDGYWEWYYCIDGKLWIKRYFIN